MKASLSDGGERNFDKCIGYDEGHVLHSVGDFGKPVISGQDTNINNRRDSVDG